MNRNHFSPPLNIFISGTSVLFRTNEKENTSRKFFRVENFLLRFAKKNEERVRDNVRYGNSLSRNVPQTAVSLLNGEFLIEK